MPDVNKSHHFTLSMHYLQINDQVPDPFDLSLLSDTPLLADVPGSSWLLLESMLADQDNALQEPGDAVGEPANEHTFDMLSASSLDSTITHTSNTSLNPGKPLFSADAYACVYM